MVWHFGTYLVGFQCFNNAIFLEQEGGIVVRRKAPEVYIYTLYTLFNLYPTKQFFILTTATLDFWCCQKAYKCSLHFSTIYPLMNCALDKLFYPFLANIVEVSLSLLYQHLIRESKIDGLLYPLRGTIMQFCRNSFS